ncbi:hypothetical protein AVEN_40825-1 [Araneus ventricosus]|uniref:Reverse transcriptase domain-containing protein n=1 Tax=Araneus ventricosus TaxID=182803 RepID=A0A4Y2CEW2_ARAVE|nr:hypothetical protein AVEN_40825-1 [Araneus ventricosus]
MEGGMFTFYLAWPNKQLQCPSYSLLVTRFRSKIVQKCLSWNIPLNHDYKINNLVSSRSNSVKDLGIIFDTKLDFSQDIDAMVSKAYRKLGILKRKTREFTSELDLKIFMSDPI